LLVLEEPLKKLFVSECLLLEDGNITNNDNCTKPRKKPKQYGTITKLSWMIMPYNHHNPVLKKFPTIMGNGSVDVDLVLITCTKLTRGDA
jgi:hypothetical protein